MATTKKTPAAKPSAPEVVTATVVGGAVHAHAEVLTDWEKTPSGVQAAFLHMLNALEALPKMQGAHGMGCNCSCCAEVQRALTAAHAFRP